MSDAIRINGLKELQAALDQLPAKIEANIMRGALRAGAKVIAEEAKVLVPKQTGALAASIKFGAKLDRRSGRVTSYIRAGKNRAKDYTHAFYAHMVEFGTKAHVIKAPPGAALNVNGILYRSVNHPGARAKPFLRPAMDAMQQTALEAAREYIRNRLSTKHGIDVPGPGNEDDPDEA